MAYASEAGIAKLHKVLKGKQMTAQQLAEASGYNVDVVNHAIRSSRYDEGCAKFRICDYVYAGCTRLRVFAADGLPDLPRDLRTRKQKLDGMPPDGIGKLKSLETIERAKTVRVPAHPFGLLIEGMSL